MGAETGRPTIEVRDAAPGDAAALSPLLEALGYPTPPEAVLARLAALAAIDPAGRTLVATLGTGILGFATLHVTPVLHRPTPVGRITSIAVHPGARGTGVGRRLVEAAEDYFRSLGLGRIELTSGTAHQAAHDFYRHLGYEDHGVRPAKPLGATLPPTG